MGRESEILRIYCLCKALLQGQTYAQLYTDVSSKFNLCLALPVLYTIEWDLKTYLVKLEKR